MENKKYQDEFEQFLQDEVKQHRMYPSDRVWSNIRTELHGYRSWPALTFIAVFIVTALTLTTVLNTNNQSTHLQPLSVPNVVAIQQEAIAANNAAHEKSKKYFSTLAPSAINTQTIERLNNVDGNNFIGPDNITPGATIADISLPKPAITVSRNNNRVHPVLTAPISNSNNEAAVLGSEPITITIANTEPSVNKEVANNKEAIDEKLILEAAPTESPYVSEAVVVKKLSSRKLSKFGFQFYITPSTSYRRLTDEKVKDLVQPAVSAALPVNAPLNQPADVNQVVRHRPAIGMELGFAVLYNITDRLKLKTGVQLNIRHYQIETFQSSTYDRATISLINFNGIENITRYSPYNNNVGYKQTELANKVYQLSLPVGIQWDVIKGKHVSLNAEASVQPTLNLNKNVYLLSTDYRHYADGNDLVRKWNINTNVGVNLSFTSGKTSWQIGPQVRYQHLPTFSNKYPIKEYLLDYGLRIGLTKALQ